MATKKKAAKKKAGAKALTATQINRALIFKIDWIKDPVPIFRKLLDREALKRIDLAKRAFGKQINEIVKNR